jgi:hypothetical protein
MLKRSSQGGNGEDAMPLEHKRALAAIAEGPLRQKRSLENEESLQDLSSRHESRIPDIHDSVWGNTPCAKRAFCQVLSAQSPDHVDLMEKKMATYLRM